MALDFAGELYVHAIAIEREAAERYAEFAERMDDDGNRAVAALFRMLAGQEARHLDELKRRTAAMELPALSSDYSWLTDGAPQTAARELVFRLMTQRDALLIALGAEKRAHSFFRHAVRVTDDAAVRALAGEMAVEESEHVGLIERMLERIPDARVDWASLVGES